MVRELAFCCLAAIMVIGCGDGREEPAITDRIINGAAVDNSDVPQMVKLTTRAAGQDLGVCSGVSISADRILTAGHCVGLGEDEILVATAAGDFSARSVQRHPAYREEPAIRAIFNDIAVISVDPLPLPALPIIVSRPVAAPSWITTYGYGVTEDGGFGALNGAPIELALVTENHLFSAPFEDGGANPCLGDSGAPAILSYEEGGSVQTGIIGVVSTGTALQCEEGDVTLFANLQNQEMLNFIAAAAPSAVFR